MIVVSRGRRYVGQEVEVTVSSVLQTAAGRMAFAELANDNAEAQVQTSADGRGKLAPVT